MFALMRMCACMYVGMLALALALAFALACMCTCAAGSTLFMALYTLFMAQLSSQLSSAYGSAQLTARRSSQPGTAYGLAPLRAQLSVWLCSAHGWRSYGKLMSEGLCQRAYGSAQLVARRSSVQLMARRSLWLSRGGAGTSRRVSADGASYRRHHGPSGARHVHGLHAYSPWAPAWHVIGHGSGHSTQPSPARGEGVDHASTRMACHIWVWTLSTQPSPLRGGGVDHASTRMACHWAWVRTLHPTLAIAGGGC